jgi:hypothetical protein
MKILSHIVVLLAVVLAGCAHRVRDTAALQDHADVCIQVSPNGMASLRVKASAATVEPKPLAEVLASLSGTGSDRRELAVAVICKSQPEEEANTIRELKSAFRLCGFRKAVFLAGVNSSSGEYTGLPLIEECTLK